MTNARKIAVIGECMIELRPNITDAGYSESTIDARGLPGMYWIDVDGGGERSFHNWRLESPRGG